jgi:broad specificity phosphatase PhoE
MGQLFLVRHATTAASAAGRNLGGLSDDPLTDAGQRLATRLGLTVALELAALPARELRVVTSPARRCRETAAAIRTAVAEPGRDVEERADPALLEIDYGAWDGLSEAECRRRDPELRAAWEADPYAVATPGGESGADVLARSAPVLEALERWSAGGTGRVAIIVSHNHVIRLRLAALLGMPLRDYRRRLSIEPGSYSVVEFRDADGQDGDGGIVRRLGVVPLQSPADGAPEGGIYNA